MLAAVAMALALSAGTAHAGSTYPIDGSTPTVSAAIFGPGGCVTVSQPGLAPGTPITFVFTDAAGTTVTVTATANASGVATAQLCISTEAAVGSGAIVVSDSSQVLGQVAVSVGGAQDDGGLAITGRSTGDTMTVALLAIVVGGVLVVLSRRRLAS